jgi:hypothetical protein
MAEFELLSLICGVRILEEPFNDFSLRTLLAVAPLKSNGSKFVTLIIQLGFKMITLTR